MFEQAKQILLLLQGFLYPVYTDYYPNNFSLKLMTIKVLSLLRIYQYDLRIPRQAVPFISFNLVFFVLLVLLGAASSPFAPLVGILQSVIFQAWKVLAFNLGINMNVFEYALVYSITEILARLILRHKVKPLKILNSYLSGFATAYVISLLNYIVSIGSPII